MEKINIKDASIASAIRNVLPLATKEDKGLLSAQFADILEKRYIPTANINSNSDLDLLYKERDSGLSIVTITSSNINTLGAGILLHIQRLPRGDSSVSQYISQLLFSMNNKVMYRSGSFPSGAPVYSTWKEM